MAWTSSSGRATCRPTGRPRRSGGPPGRTGPTACRSARWSDSISISVGASGPLRPGAYAAGAALQLRQRARRADDHRAGRVVGDGQPARSRGGEPPRLRRAGRRGGRRPLPRSRSPGRGRRLHGRVHRQGRWTAASRSPSRRSSTAIRRSRLPSAAASLDLLTAEQKQAVKAGQLPIVGLHPSNLPAHRRRGRRRDGVPPGHRRPASLQPAELDRLRLLNVTGKLPPGQTITFQESNAGTTGTTQREIGTTTADAGGRLPLHRRLRSLELRRLRDGTVHHGLRPDGEVEAMRRTEDQGHTG